MARSRLEGSLKLPPRRGSLQWWEKKRAVLPRVLTLEEAALILRIRSGNVKWLIKNGVLHGFRNRHQPKGQLFTTDLALLAYMGYPSHLYPTVMPPQRGDIGYAANKGARWSDIYPEKAREAYRKTRERNRTGASLLPNIKAAMARSNDGDIKPPHKLPWFIAASVLREQKEKGIPVTARDHLGRAPSEAGEE